MGGKDIGMTHRWEQHNKRVKYICPLEYNPIYTTYICLDNKFHSWVVGSGHSEYWKIQTLENPDRVYEYISFYTWMNEISQ